MATEYKKYIPTLRFPEFQNDGEWTSKLIKDIANTFSGGTPTVGNRNYYGGSIPFIRSGEIAKSTTDLFITELGLSSSSAKVVEEGTILYALYGATSGEVAISKIRGAINQAILAIIPKSRKYVVNYIYYFLKHQKAQILSKYLQGGQGNLSGAIIDNLSIAFPCDYKGNISVVEQKKIADCFVSIDKEIDATKRKLEQLKDHKKGLLQLLFPAKGKTTPELRFQEFQNDGEWVEVSFGSIINVNSGKDYKHLDIGNIPVYGTGGYMLSVNDKLSDIDAVGIGRKGTIDKPQYLKAPFWTVDTLFFLTSSKNYDIRYLYYLCQTIPWKTYGEQTGVPSISKNSIDKLDVVITTNLTEQQKIAQSLLHLDNAMDAIEKKIHLLETHKYGLMQNLFPNLNNY